MSKCIASLTFQTEYYSAETLSEKKGMILPKQLKIELSHKAFLTPIGGGIPFGVVYLEITHFDLDSGEIEIRQAYNLVEACQAFRYFANLYDYTDKFAEDAEASLIGQVNRIKKVLHSLNSNGMYTGLEEFKKMKTVEASELETALAE